MQTNLSALLAGDDCAVPECKTDWTHYLYVDGAAVRVCSPHAHEFDEEEGTAITRLPILPPSQYPCYA